MEKILYITFQHFTDCDGVTKKTLAQKSAIEVLGYHVDIIFSKYVDGFYRLFFNKDIVMENVYHGNKFKKMMEIVVSESYKAVYIRYSANSTYYFVKFLSDLKRKGIRVFVEIPTYPYDGEIKLSFSKQCLIAYRDRFFRKFMKSSVDYIVTTSQEKVIFGIPTINISNAPAYIPPLIQKSVETGRFRIVTVANIAFWHGYDRLIAGLKQYYDKNPVVHVLVDIVGDGNPEIVKSLKKQVIDCHMENYICFLGSKDSTELDEIFKDADFAIGCLGCHRKNIVEVKSLKNVEYAMRGIPFAYSEKNADFDLMPYVLKIPSDDSPINIEDILTFYKNSKMDPQEIRKSVQSMTWEAQMQKVFSYLPI